MKKIALYFGSFNPVHIGHLIIANYCLTFSEMDALYFVLSPQNPLKEEKDLLGEQERLEMLKMAIQDNAALQISDVEFRLSKPSYTIDSLKQLKIEHPNASFHILLGEDNLQDFDKWKDYESILAEHNLLVYPRLHSDASKFYAHPNVRKLQAPIIEISSSFIRKAIKLRKDVRYMLHPTVYDYINTKKYYR